MDYWEIATYVLAVIGILGLIGLAILGIYIVFDNARCTRMLKEALEEEMLKLKQFENEALPEPEPTPDPDFGDRHPF